MELKTGSGRFESYNSQFFVSWFVIFLPYIIFNFIRSIVYSIKQIKSK